MSEPVRHQARKVNPVRRFLCWLGVHKWATKHKDSQAGYYEVCRYCPTKRSDY